MRGKHRFSGMASGLSFLLLSGLGLAASIVIHQITVTTLCENFQPTISGDGKRIVFLSDCEIIPGSNTDMNYEIFLFDTETKRFLQITDTTGQKNNQPTINEDGTRVAFGSSADLIPGQNTNGNPEIFLYDTRIKVLTQLTHTRPPAVNSGPSLSGDGDKVIFLSSADLIKRENPEGKTEVFLFEKKTGRFTQLTHTPSSSSTGKGTPQVVNLSAVVSRNGTKVVIASTADLIPGENKDGSSQLFLYNLTMKTIAQLTRTKGKIGQGHQHGPPAVSDNGSRIFFLSAADLAHEDHREGRPAIFLLETSTMTLTSVIETTGCQLHSPSINGDGTKITFASTCDFIGENNDPGGANMEIFLYDTTTKTITQLTHTIRDFNHTPSMDRSGTRIAFGSDRDILRGSNLDENSEIFLAFLPPDVMAGSERGTGLAASHIVIDPNNPKMIYVSSTFYGVYKSTDSGITWRLTNKGVGAPDFYALAIHPRDSRLLYVGAAGGGIYRSEDGGETWKEANTGLTDTSVYDIVFDARNPDILYTLTLREVFKSTNGGLRWRPVFQEERWITDSSYHRRLQVVPTGQSTLFLIGTSERGYRREEGDRQWTLLGSGLKDAKVTAFAYETRTKAIYAGAVFAEGLYKSTDSGTTWTLMGTGLKQVWVNRIVLDPVHPQVIYLATKNKGVLKSEDGGGSWKAINNGITEIDIKALAIHPTNPQYLYLGTYGRGIFTSTDGGAHWVHRSVPLYPTWEELNTSLARKVQAKPQAPPPPQAFSKCQTCHAWTDPILNGDIKQTFWRAFPSHRDWGETMERMKGPAQLTPDEETAILQYLNTYYGPG